MSEAVFLIVKQEPDGQFQLIGTGFFIAENGVFATAKHVLMDVLDGDERQTHPIGLIQFLPGNQYILRPIDRCTSNTIADVSVGVAKPARHNITGEPLPNKIVTLTVVPPIPGARVATYAYPKTVARESELHFFPAFYDGLMEEHFPDGRDKVIHPAPCYRTSIHVHGGASGGPVFRPDGDVFGINSTGIDGTDVSFVSRVDEP